MRNEIGSGVTMRDCRGRGGIGTIIDVTSDLGLADAGSMTLQEILFTISPSYLNNLFTR